MIRVFDIASTEQSKICKQSNSQTFTAGWQAMQIADPLKFHIGHSEIGV